MGIPAAIAGSVVTGLFNKRSADKQMRFQDQQSRTQYQRAVADMKSAGLNPMLAAKLGGNAAMSGAMGTMPDLGATMNSATSIANTQKVQEAQVGKINQEIVNLGLQSVAKGLDNIQKEMLVIFEKSLSPEAYKLYKMPMLKMVAEGLKVPEIVVELGDSEAYKVAKNVGAALVNPVQTISNLFNWATANGRELRDKYGDGGFDSLRSALYDAMQSLTKRK